VNKVKTRILVGLDGNLSARTVGLPAGEYEAEISLLDEELKHQTLDFDALLVRVRAIQAAVAQLPVLDGRSAEELIGYDESGHF
jgi:hypothetical protein